MREHRILPYGHTVERVRFDRAPELRGSAVAARAPLTLADAGETIITPELVALPDNYALLWEQSGEEVVMRLYNTAGKAWAAASADDGRTWHAAAETAPTCAIRPTEAPAQVEGQ